MQTYFGEFLSCKNESIDCYVIDNNGFVIISENPLNTGKFFGEVEGTILKALVKHEVFKKIKIFDYQAICLEDARRQKTQPYSCDKETYLYELDETTLQAPVQGILRNCHESSCERPFSVALIPNTNLVLVVADKLCPCYSAGISVAPTKVAYGPKNESTSNYCKKIKSNLYRRKLFPQMFYHPQVRGATLYYVGCRWNQTNELING